MTIYYHGTTQKGLDAILSGIGKIDGPWTCSDNDGCTYLWDAKRMIESGEIEEQEEVIPQAFESAQIQAAIAGEDTMLYVLALELDESEVQDDESCENMSDTCSYVDEDRVTRETIVNVYRCEFSKWNSPFVISSLIGMNYFDDSNIDSSLIKIAQAMSESVYYPDDLLEFDYEEVEL